jgi:mono/diheme cytochrome c family protein
MQKLKRCFGALVIRKVDQGMKNRIKKLAIALIGLPLMAIILLDPATARTTATADDFDAATVYKAKCAMCHGAKAEKKFDATKADDQLFDTVLKGKEGTPKMPAYEKTFSPEQAKALVAYMKSLKQ